MLRGMWVIVLGLLLLGACARGGSGGGDASAEPVPEPVAEPVRVEVLNRYALPMEIYAVGSGINYRMGLVHPGMTGSFVVPPGLVGGGSVEFRAQPSVRGPSFRSAALLLAPGAVVDVLITAQLFNSTAAIRP